MNYPNILVFVDFPVGDVDAANRFYSEVFGWEIEERIPGVFHRIVPGQNFKLDDGTQGPTGNLHMGISYAGDPRPRPESEHRRRPPMFDGGRTTTGVDPRLRRRRHGRDHGPRRGQRRHRACGATTSGPSSAAPTPRSSTRGATS